MVPPSSDRISRVPPYLSQAWFHTTRFCVRGYHPLWPAFPDRFANNDAKTCWLLRVRSPLLPESRVISVPSVTEMFQFTEFALPPLCIQVGVTPTSSALRDLTRPSRLVWCGRLL